MNLAAQWRPISEYKPDVGPCLVWVQWPLDQGGAWYRAYTIEIKGEAVWVDAKDSIPLESTGRRVTHWAFVSSPFPPKSIQLRASDTTRAPE